MHYQYSNITGRLTGTTNPHALYPITPLPLNKSEAPTVIYANAKLSKVAEPRAMSSSAAGSVPERLRQKMERFQRKDGLPIFLKGGPLDRGLYGFTMALCVVGMGLTVKLIYDLGFPKKH